MTKNKRNVVIPGEILAEGSSYLAGEGTLKSNDKILATRYGLSEERDNFVKVVPLSGIYTPRRNNTVIGRVEGITQNGWIISIGVSENAFIPLSEVSGYVERDELEKVMDIGDMVVAKIWNIGRRGVDLSIKQRGLGRLHEGIVIKVNPSKVPRIIGREGSMIKIIKDNTNCNVSIGQNGFILIKGDKIDDELFAKKAINFVVENSFVSGLTESVIKWFRERK